MIAKRGALAPASEEAANAGEGGRHPSATRNEDRRRAARLSEAVRERDGAPELLVRERAGAELGERCRRDARLAAVRKERARVRLHSSWSGDRRWRL